MMSPSRLRVFDDSQSIYPFTLTRPAIDLRLGALRLWEKIAVIAPGRIGLLVSDALAPVVAERGDTPPVNEPLAEGPTWFLNGRTLYAARFWRSVVENLVELPAHDEYAVRDGDRVMVALLGEERARRFGSLIRAGRSPLEAIEGIPVGEEEGTWVEQPWDLVQLNAAEIAADWERLGGQKRAGVISSAASFYRPENIRIEAGAKVEAGAVLDAREGPVLVGEGAVIHPLAYVQGPAAIGPSAEVMPGARVRAGTSLGPGCRVGGEVEHSLFHSWTNKYHDGFIGHSAIGAWCNLGALTTTSDLKNTYGTVRVALPDGERDTGERKIGCFLGDHVRLGIGSLLTSGAVVGPAVNLFGGGLLPKAVPPFSWGGATGMEEYEVERFLQTAEIAMSRRGVRLGPAERALYRRIAALRRLQ
ncbi:MAG: putative sugar nucleotidyl transferase [Dehalococcoidia bacterium]|nr:putative sugar nucleotidyl transferase [Dehalococcoidia bacterium]